MDYFNARMYQPRTGKFSAPDPAPGSLQDPGSWNRFGYVRGNPLRLVDPMGLTAVDTHCFSASGAKWCPGVLVVPDNPRHTPGDDSAAVGYEFGTELNAGLADYGAQQTFDFLLSAAPLFHGSPTSESDRSCGRIRCAEVTNGLRNPIRAKGEKKSFPQDGDPYTTVGTGDRAVDVDGVRIGGIILRVGDYVHVTVSGSMASPEWRFDGVIDWTLNSIQVTGGRDGTGTHDYRTWILKQNHPDWTDPKYRQ